MAHSEESALLARVRRGDPAALGELLTAHQGRLYNLCLRLVGHREDAAELTQEALLKAVAHLDRFRGEAQIATWLTRIATNEAITHLRRRRLRRHASLDAEAGGDNGEAGTLSQRVPDSREPSPEQRVQHQERGAWIQAGLDRLEPDFRAVLILRDIEQMEYQQIAEVLELPVGTVKSRLFRARLGLREHLSKLESEQAGGSKASADAEGAAPPAASPPGAAGSNAEGLEQAWRSGEGPAPGSGQPPKEAE